eukprot:scaffold95826_cov48-Phaeocystis_antarctica.AAC.1
MPSFRLSAVRVGVQPAAELRRLQRHEHVRDVQGALLPVPCPQPAVEPSPARCACRGRPPPAQPPDRYASPRIVCTPFDSRQLATAFNQPLSFDTSSFTTMDSMFSVRSSPRPAPYLQSSPRLCTLRAPRSPAASRLPARTSSRTACPPFALGRSRGRSTSR